MGESAAVATVGYPMQVETKSSKKMRSSLKRKATVSRTESPLKAPKPACKSTTDVPGCSKERPSCPTPTVVKQEYKMRLARDVDTTGENSLNGDSHIAPSSCTVESDESGSVKPREREKLMENPLRITSPELLGSNLLQSALLYGLSDAVLGTEAPEYLPKPESSAKRRNRKPKAKLSRSFEEENEQSGDEDRNRTQLFAPGTLIHLEAGEPIRIRRWSKPQVVDFFAQTLAYDLMEDTKH